MKWNWQVVAQGQKRGVGCSRKPSAPNIDPGPPPTPLDTTTGVSHFRPEDRRKRHKTADRAHSSQFVRTGRSHRPSQLIKRGWDGVWGIRNTLLRSCSIEPTELSVLIKIVREVQVPINCRVINHKVAGSRLVPSRQVGMTNLPVYKH